MSNCLIFITMLLVFLCGSSTGHQDDSGRDFIVAELIHRDSSLSPFYNSSKSASERMREAVARSLNSIITSNLSQHFNEKSVMSWMIPNEADYLMKIKSDKPKEFLLMASTATGFTWIDCKDQAGEPYFETKMDGGSYEQIPRNSDECRGFGDIQPGPLLLAGTTETCDYTYSYHEKVKTRGILSSAEFQFHSADTKSIFNSRNKGSILLFGCCTRRIKSTFKSHIQGMAGLGHGDDGSLISQLVKRRIRNKQFSYCLLPLWTNHPTKLVFGKNKIFQGKRASTIPFRTMTDSPYYYLTLKYVGVQSAETQKLQKAYNNMIIDSGTTVTSLDPTLFEEVISFVKTSLSSLQPVEELTETNPFKLCYNLLDTSAQDKFPNIELHFGGNGEKTSITLKYENIYVEYTDDKNREMICMNIVPAATDGVSVLGNVAQLGFYVEYDLANKKIYFTPADCKKFGTETT